MNLVDSNYVRVVANIMNTTATILTLIFDFEIKIFVSTENKQHSSAQTFIYRNQY